MIRGRRTERSIELFVRRAEDIIPEGWSVWRNTAARTIDIKQGGTTRLQVPYEPIDRSLTDTLEEVYATVAAYPEPSAAGLRAMCDKAAENIEKEMMVLVKAYPWRELSLIVETVTHSTKEEEGKDDRNVQAVSAKITGQI